MPLPGSELPHMPSRGARGQALFEMLRGAILEGTLAPGERLIEEEIAARFSVSRTPVREAIHKLETAGLVLGGRDGAVVGGFTLEEFADVCAVRETLEGMAAGLAAAASGPLQLFSIQQTLRDFSVAFDQSDVRAMQLASRAFHSEIARNSRNAFLAKMLLDVDGLVDRFQHSTLTSPQRQRLVLAEHEAIYGAIASRKAEEADRLAREHFRNITVVRLDMLRGRMDLAKARKS